MLGLVVTEVVGLLSSFGVWKLLKETRPDLLPRNHIGGGFAHAGQCGGQAPPVARPSVMRSPLPGFPDRIEQIRFLCGGEAIYRRLQVAHMTTNLARFFLCRKLYFPAPAVLFFLRVQQAEQHFLDAAGAGGLELLSDSGLQDASRISMVMVGSYV
jgi:hypothetical protein